jgi:tetratricopeptide (TPR) repeat protein
MKKMKQILTVLVLVFAVQLTFAQDEATIKYNLFKGDAVAKKYDKAYENWMWCMDNSPKLTVNIYKLGIKIAMHKLKNAADETEKKAAMDLVDRVYSQRLEHFGKDKAKVYSDWATFRISQGDSDDEVFELLEKAFKVDPTRMSGKNIFKYFDIIMQKHKSSNPQIVFDTYDEVGEGIELKRSYYSKKINAINAKDSLTLSSKDKRNRKIYQQNMTALAQVETGLDVKIAEISTCENLVPLYKKYFEEKKEDAQWLRRAVSRMYNKECTDDAFYPTLVEAYVHADPSPNASVFYAGILMKRGETNKAMDYFKRAIEQENDSYKKAQNLLKVAQILSKKGRKSEARKYCYDALKYEPTMGNAYLLIGVMYAQSANSCGKDLVSKRMVYAAAIDKLRKAKAVDPSIASKANKYINQFSRNLPTKKDLFTAETPLSVGSAFKINCWIGETTRVRTRD